MGLADEYAEWLDQQQALGYLSANTVVAYRHAARLFCKRHPNIRVAEVTRAHAQAWLGTFRGLSSSTIGVRLAALGSFYDELVADDKLDANPFDSLRRPRKRARSIRQPAPAGLIDRVLVECPQREATMIGCAFFAGLRRMEIAKLRESDINWEESTLSVIGKGDRPGTIPVPSRLLELLRSWVDDNDIEPGQWLFKSQRGGHLSPQRVGELVTAASHTLGHHVTAHQWRHRAGTDMARSGGLKNAQMLLRHSSSATTDGYVHTGVEDLRSAMKELHK